MMLYVITTIHPFADGNGRSARAAANTELSAAGEERLVITTVGLVITTVDRERLVSHLRQAQETHEVAALVQEVQSIQSWTANLNWGSVEMVREELLKQEKLARNDLPVE